MTLIEGMLRLYSRGRKTSRMAKLTFWLSSALAGVCLVGCAKEDNQAAGGTAAPPGATKPATVAGAVARTVTMKMGNDTFHLEVAANDRDRARGLMYRESMPIDHGMIFVFGPDQEREFWMRNTLIPLDIIYVNGAGRIVSIKHGVPLQEDPTVPSDEPMKWAIELNEGVAGATGLRVGSKLAIPAEARDPQEN
jgi:uncharacterized membrane protein (UPF0127 family)